MVEVKQDGRIEGSINCFPHQKGSNLTTIYTYKRKHLRTDMKSQWSTHSTWFYCRITARGTGEGRKTVLNCWHHLAAAEWYKEPLIGLGEGEPSNCEALNSMLSCYSRKENQNKLSWCQPTEGAFKQPSPERNCQSQQFKFEFCKLHHWAKVLWGSK